ncbi:MAG: cysteine--tRNA ligase [Deltaproteobacteria bacterium]|nr:MAG: cysteine--tRNA ligase [Deltaproteobacteria bacterium]
MTLRIYNTLTRTKEVFQPMEPGHVKMYVCGPTVYDACHIGHARSVVVFDVMARYLRAIGNRVTYIRNFTDVDDKIIQRAASLGENWSDLANRYIDAFHTDMDALYVERATEEPKATDHIPHIIEFIASLIEKGHAYPADGDVYFAVASFDGYGKLSGRKLADMEAGARIDIDPRKRNPFDFALWKGAKPGEPAWNSPWGSGRPGWHIECSAMSRAYLGDGFDIHGGGKDLIFPHHENEIAQSESACGCQFVRYWIHNGFVNIDQEKMSKSLGNFKMIKDVMQYYPPEVIRLFLLSNHYRSPIDFTDQNMDEARSGLEKLYGTLRRVKETFGWGRVDLLDLPQGPVWEQFCAAMDDDFNSARAIGGLFDTSRELNRLMDADNVTPDTVKGIAGDMVRTGTVLGLLMEDAAAFFESRKTAALETTELDAAAIEARIAERNQARKEKNFARADAIRDELLEKHILLEDKVDGTHWKVKE